MSVDYRDYLMDQAVSSRPRLSAFLKIGPLSTLQILANWDVIALGFGKAFEALWDHAKVDSSGLLQQPLFMLWRQSVELSIKAALVEIERHLDSVVGHDIEALFERLSLALADLGYPQDSDLTQSVQKMVSEVQALDRSADRFRYPAARNGKVFDRVDADLDKLF